MSNKKKKVMWVQTKYPSAGEHDLCKREWNERNQDAQVSKAKESDNNWIEKAELSITFQNTNIYLA